MNSTFFTERFSFYIKNKKLFEASDTLLVACSGGVDSVVAAYLLFKSGFKIELAHCNFALRGTEADKDEAFVKQLAEEWEVPFHSIRFNTKAFAKEKGVSTQMAARELRYSWFAKLLAAKENVWLVTAHHADDQIETVLFNAIKGGGIASFHGISPQKKQMIRPLLWASKEEIIAFAQEEQLQWREDQSNVSNHYQRNKLRNRVVPILKEINPNLTSTLTATTERITATENLLGIFIDAFRKENVEIDNQQIKILLEGIKKYGNNPVLLFELLKPFNFNYRQSVQLADSLEGQVGKVFKSDTHQFLIDRAFLRIEPIPKGDLTVSDEGLVEVETQKIVFGKNELTFYQIEAANYILKKSRFIGEFDFAKLQFPLKIRLWKEGDRFQPLGMKGKKLVSDFLTDRKIDRFEKDKVMVLTSGNTIIWVIGYQVSHLYKITRQTSSIYQVHFKSE